jgi:hypothetical protein
MLPAVNDRRPAKGAVISTAIGLLRLRSACAAMFDPDRLSCRDILHIIVEQVIDCGKTAIKYTKPSRKPDGRLQTNIQADRGKNDTPHQQAQYYR